MQPAIRLFAALLLAALLGHAAPAAAQTDLLKELETQRPDSLPPARDITLATFKGTHIINSQSVETPGQGTLLFLIQHRFGALNSGAYEFFGLDQAVLRLSFEYGLTDRLTVGVGRGSMEKTFDGFLKYRALRQSDGARAMPVSVTLLASSALTSLRFPAAERSFASRLAYTYQALVARKISPALSVQLMPTVIHRNFVDTRRAQNDVYALGGAFRQKLTKRVALTADYFYLLPGATADEFRNPIGLGFDIETGGHVFQLHFTNSQGMIEKFFIPETRGRVSNGDIFFGFNVVRAFTVKDRR
ncbi:hypothetical protein SAMN02745146_1315 [Hymenobacter daecheongensis DSM 21074]|uniref:DUF5777 domain-containing protein n=1 Tax=Hymenobacter daecheongensis DSM 21074 TaxID=1121955 RepID=A0A1M6CYR2_9BACT|nr:DUF5777 family beta-barrel protein [Hymenobacter daecheongensis]SHI66013.1 hypothetical protein SAMN02745146_1315 [Hymenobacter daecheongensis DSM 21074]